MKAFPWYESEKASECLLYIVSVSLYVAPPNGPERVAPGTLSVPVVLDVRVPACQMLLVRDRARGREEQVHDTYIPRLIEKRVCDVCELAQVGVVSVAVVNEADMQIFRAMYVVWCVVHGAVDTVGKERAEEGDSEHSREERREHCEPGSRR